MIAEQYKDILSSDPETLGGTVCFKDTRIPLRILQDHIEGELPIEEFLEGYPSVPPEHAQIFWNQLKALRNLAVRELDVDPKPTNEQLTDLINRYSIGQYVPNGSLDEQCVSDWILEASTVGELNYHEGRQYYALSDPPHAVEQFEPYLLVILREAIRDPSDILELHGAPLDGIFDDDSRWPDTTRTLRSIVLLVLEHLGDEWHRFLRPHRLRCVLLS